MLIHLLDGLAEDPLLDFAQINSELALFDPDLARKPQVVALNKIDLPEVQERWAKVSAGLKSRGYEAMAVSAVTGKDVRKLLYRAAELLAEAPELPPTTEVPVYTVTSDPREFTIQRADRGWRVKGEAIERAAAMTYWEFDQSVNRFQRLLETLGVEKALRKAGIKNGETVYIGEYELEWED